MNKSTFLFKLKESVEKISHEKLKYAIMQIAEDINNDKYEGILKLFKELDRIDIDIMEDEEDELDEEGSLVNDTIELCKAIENGEYYFKYIDEEEFDDNDDYDDDDYYDDYRSDDLPLDEEDYTLEDRDDLGPEIEGFLEDAISYVVQYKRYEEAYKTFDLLFNVKIRVDGYDDIDISTLFSERLIDEITLEDTCLYYAYSAIMFLRGTDRCENLYRIMTKTYSEIKFQDIMKIMDFAIPEEEEFKHEWIEFLLKQDVERSEDIIIDSVKFFGGIEALEDFAKKYGAQYPKSYLDLISIYKSEKKLDFAVKSAEDGLANIKGQNSNKTKMAEMLYEIGKDVNDSNAIKIGTMEAFKSTLDLNHFMDLYKLNDKEIIKEMTKYMGEFPIKQSYKFDDSYIHFLNGDYELIYDMCKEDKDHLSWSWSHSFKEHMIPLFTALLAKTNPINPCIVNFIKYNFQYNNRFEEFIKLLASSFEEISEADHKKYMSYCLSEAEYSVKKIVGGQDRYNYDKISALIVSLAEVMLLSGNYESAINYIKLNKDKYPKHRSFHNALLKDIKLAGINMNFYKL